MKTRKNNQILMLAAGKTTAYLRGDWEKDAMSPLLSGACEHRILAHLYRFFITNIGSRAFPNQRSFLV